MYNLVSIAFKELCSMMMDLYGISIMSIISKIIYAELIVFALF